jgi:hypothetical protein
MPAKTTPSAATKPPAPPIRKTDSAPTDRISFGLLSLLVGSVALSFYSVPYLMVRILAVMLSLGGITLAVLQLRSNEKAGRNFNGAIAGTLFSAAVILLTAIGPYLPVPAKRVARAPTRASAPKTRDSVTQTTESVPQLKTSPEPAQAVSQTRPAEAVSQTTPGAIEKPNEVPQIPANVPKVIPFPCRKSFQLVPGGTGEWVDAATSAIGQGEIAVCIASAAIEQLELPSAGNTVSSRKDNLVIHLQVMLVGTTGKVDFQSWGNSNFGDTGNKPKLTNDSTNVPLRTFDASTKIPGHERPKGLYPKLYADDYLIFETPQSIADHLRLELPATAFGGVGTLRFQIPKSMIDGMQDRQPSK